MIGIPIALVFANASEWLLHKHVLHKRGRDKKSVWAFHWYEHHGNSRRNEMADPTYARFPLGWHAQGKELAAGGPTVPIIRHPDVRRMLMLMKSQTEAMRALAYVVAAAMDFAQKTTDKKHQAFVDLMIPVVKGWSTETGICARISRSRHSSRSSPGRIARHAESVCSRARSTS